MGVAESPQAPARRLGSRPIQPETNRIEETPQLDESYFNKLLELAVTTCARSRSVRGFFVRRFWSSSQARIRCQFSSNVPFLRAIWAWIAAASLDRYLQSTGKPQVFGTQYASKSFFYFTQHPVNPDLNNPDAKDTTISQEPYDSSRISDSVRRTFCVVDLDTQKKNVTALNEHKPLVRRPQGCPEE